MVSRPVFNIIIKAKLLCLFALSSLCAESKESVESLFQQVRIDQELRKELLATLKITDALQSGESRKQIYTEMERMLVFLRDIPALKKGTYTDKQSQLLAAAAIALKQEERPYYQAYDSYENQYVVFDPEQDQRQIAVFKPAEKRDVETLIWELACLFGIEDAVTPTIPLTLYGRSGELQAFQKSDLTVEQSSEKSWHCLVTFESYWKSALAVLLFALHDMDNENCYFHFLREGYIRLGMYNTKDAFSRTCFEPYQQDTSYPSLTAPFCWIGWDFPQRERPITKRFKEAIVGLVGSWPGRIDALKTYLIHSKSLSQEEADGIIQRAMILRNTILSHPEQPIKNWHEKISPEYSEASKRLKEFFPEQDTSWILFQLRWQPMEAYELIPYEKQEDFKTWLKRFLYPSFEVASNCV